MAQIRYGQIGVGHAHASKMSVYRSSDDYDVVGVSESDPELRKRFTDHAAYRDLKWMTEEELLNAPGLQVVGVETKVRDLLPTAEKCVAAGKHVHIDKPAGESLPLFRSILDEAAKKHLAVQMGYMYRFNPAVLFMQDCLKKGWLGEPFEVHTVMSKVVAASSRKGLAEYPGGIMFELGCHILDVAMGVLGRPESVHPVRQHASKIDDTLVDNMLATLVYPKAIATVKSSAMEVEGFSRRHFVVCGTEGTLHIEPLDRPNVRVAFSSPRGKYSKGYQTVEFGNYSRYVGDAADLAKIIRGEKDAEFGYDHDLAVQETLLKACEMPLT
jgi:predicted dehydrogenase